MKRSVRTPPPGCKPPTRAQAVAALLERDGPLCQCGCDEPLDLDTCEVEHRIALWQADNLPDDKRAWYFGLENLRLFNKGPQHHGRKTTQEAARRAHYKRLERTCGPALLVGRDGQKLI